MHRTIGICIAGVVSVLALSCSNRPEPVEVKLVSSDQAPTSVSPVVEPDEQSTPRVVDSDSTVARPDEGPTDEVADDDGIESEDEFAEPDPVQSELEVEVPTALDVVLESISGMTVRYWFREPGRPIYGWNYMDTFAYCSDGSYQYEIDGIRTTPLDNTETYYDTGTGVWSGLEVGQAGVRLFHQHNSGGQYLMDFFIGDGVFNLPEGWNLEYLGASGC